MTISSTAGRHSACKQTTDDDFRKETAAMHETDEQIYSRFLAEGCEDDLRILLERHRDGLILFLFSFVHNMEDAEELMLDAFAEAAAGAGFSGRSSRGCTGRCRRRTVGCACSCRSASAT